MEKISDEDKEVLKGNMIPGVSVKVQDPLTTQFDMSVMHTIREKIENEDKRNRSIDFNTFMDIALMVADHFEITDVTKTIETFYNLFAGQPITLNSVIMFWMYILEGYRK